MEKTRRHGSGRPVYWAHVAGPTERRGSVRMADTAFELMPLATARNPYDNVLLVDLGTHPRLIPAKMLSEMLAPGVYLTEIARRSMPVLDEASLKRTTLVTGETVWTVIDTTVAFGAYWKEQEPVDASKAALEAQHRRIRALSEGCDHLPINVFPIPYETVIAMRNRHMLTIRDLMSFDLHGVQMQSDLNATDIAEAYRIIRSTLEARPIETLPMTRLAIGR